MKYMKCEVCKYPVSVYVILLTILNWEHVLTDKMHAFCMFYGHIHEVSKYMKFVLRALPTYSWRSMIPKISQFWFSLELFWTVWTGVLLFFLVIVTNVFHVNVLLQYWNSLGGQPG